MFYVANKCRKFNNFKRVKVLTTKDLYMRLGERVPQSRATGGIAVFNLSKVDAMSIGHGLAEEALQSLHDSSSSVVVEEPQADDKVSQPDVVQE